MVQVVAILTSLAFAGVIFVVLGLVFFGGGGTSAQDQARQVLDERLTAVRANPTADGWQDVAFAYGGTGELDRAVAAQRKAVALAPADASRVAALAEFQRQNNDVDGAIASLQAFTARNPTNAQGFLNLGTAAEQAGRTALARLSYLAFLRLAPDDTNAAAVRQKLTTLK